ncbi:hypothetical protein [Glycomyces tarimensis]
MYATNIPEQSGEQAVRHHHPGRGGKRRFLLHYVEMVIAMLVGMFVIGGAVRGALALAEVEFGSRTHPELVAVEMALDMTVGMVLWMRVRGHGWPAILEMAAVMLAPVPVLLPLLWSGVIGYDMLMLVEHVAMFALMFLAMLRRSGEYGGRTS